MQYNSNTSRNDSFTSNFLLSNIVHDILLAVSIAINPCESPSKPHTGMSAVAHFMDNRYEKIPLTEFKKKLVEEIRQCFWNFQNVIKNHFKLNILNWIEHILNLQDQNESLETKTIPFKRRVKEEKCRNKNSL